MTNKMLEIHCQMLDEYAESYGFNPQKVNLAWGIEYNNNGTTEIVSKTYSDPAYIISTLHLQNGMMIGFDCHERQS